MNYIDIKSRVPSGWIFLVVAVLAAATGGMISLSPYLALGLFAFLALTFFCFGNPLRATSLLILFFPFSEAMHMRDRLVDLPGAKPVFLLGLFALAVLLAKRHDFGAMPKMGRNFLIAVYALFSIAIFRALPHLDLINLHFTEELNTTRFLMSYYVKPLVFLLPFFVTAKLVKSHRNLSDLTTVMSVALGALSIAILAVFIFRIGTFDLVVATDVYAEYFGMHRNNLASFFVLGLPLVLYDFNSKRSMIRFLIVACCLVSVGVLFSRTAYLTTLFTFFAFSLSMNKHRLISWSLFVLLLLTFVFNNAISDRASKGIEERDVNTLAAGRVEYIWVPLLQELARNPDKLLLGSGRFAIAYSDAARDNQIQFVFHPHNMYLEQLLDVGLLGVIIFWATLGVVLKRLIRLARNDDDESLKTFARVLLVSIGCFFLSGVTGRTLFPDLPTSYLWFVLGSAVALLNIAEGGETHEPA